MICNYLTNGIRINEDGSVVPCCALVGNLGINYKDGFDFENFKNLEPVLNLQKQLANSNWPSQCVNCSQMEMSKQLSLRQKSLINLKDKKLLDVVLGKECNSDCVMCYAGQSSKISSRLKNNKPTFAVLKEDEYWIVDNNDKNWIDNSKFWEDLNKFFINVDKIKFIGGEPFLNKKFWAWLDNDIVNENKKFKEIEIVTNGSIIYENKLSVLEGWKNCVVCFSIDATDKEYEWIRHGLKWKTIVDNIKLLKTSLDIFLTIHITLSIFSITSIPKLLTWIEENNFVFTSTPVYSPSLLALDRTPIHLLQHALKEINEIKSSTIQNQIQIQGIKEVINQAIINNKADSRLTKEIVNYFNNHRTHKMNWETLTCTT